MTTTDANGIVFLEETDPISPFHTLMNTLQQGTSDAIDAINTASSDPDRGVFVLPGANIDSTAPSGALADYGTSLTGTITDADPGVYLVAFTIGLRGSSGPAAAYLRLVAGPSSTLIYESRADVELNIGRFYNGLGLYTHTGGNLTVNLQLKTGQSLHVNTGGTTRLTVVKI